MEGTERDGGKQSFEIPDEGELYHDSPLGPGESPDRRSVSVAKRQLATETKTTTPAQRILLLTVWQQSGLGATEFSAIVGFAPHTLYDWKKRFQQDGPAGLIDGKRGRRAGSRMPEATQRAILLLKAQHPTWGCDRIHDVLMRAEGYGASPGAIQPTQIAPAGGQNYVRSTGSGSADTSPKAYRFVRVV